MEDTPRKLPTKRRKKKKWTRKRIRRYVKAWAFRILALLILLTALFLAATVVKAVVRAVTGADRNPAQAETYPEYMILPQDPGNDTAADDSEQDPLNANESAESENSLDSDGQSAGSNTPQTASADPQSIRTFTLTATGDMTFGRSSKKAYPYSFDEFYDNNGADFFLENTRDIFKADDLTLGNLEVALTESTKKASKKTPVYLKGKPEYTKILSGSSVEMVSLGNNHSGDYSEQGTADTEGSLDQAGVKWALNETVGYYTSPEGIKVGLVSKEVIPVTDANTAEMVNGVKEARSNGANIVIAACHWGSEKDYSANPPQIELAHALIDAGADVVIGNHPHVLQGVEYYKGRVICYSLGNFCFGGNRKPYDWDAIMFQQTFTLYDGVVQTDKIDARVIPIWTASNKSNNNYQPLVVDGQDKQKILDKVNQYSTSLGDVRVDENGILYQTAQ